MDEGGRAKKRSPSNPVIGRRGQKARETERENFVVFKLCWGRMKRRGEVLEVGGGIKCF